MPESPEPPVPRVSERGIRRDILPPEAAFGFFFLSFLGFFAKAFRSGIAGAGGGLGAAVPNKHMTIISLNSSVEFNVEVYNELKSAVGCGYST